MIKRIALAAMLGVVLAGSAVLAQDAGNRQAGRVRPKLGAAIRQRLQRRALVARVAPERRA